VRKTGIVQLKVLGNAKIRAREVLGKLPQIEMMCQDLQIHLKHMILGLSEKRNANITHKT